MALHARMTYHIDDTIAAVATAPGGAARGIVRISGSDTIPILARCFAAADQKPLGELRQAMALPGHVRIALGRVATSLEEGRGGPANPGVETLARTTLTAPCDLFIWPTCRSYTRQPAAELHTIGSPPVLAAVLAAVCEAGARLAEPGEFTLRAFLSGRIDLTQAEAVLGIVDARGESDLAASLAQLAGGLARPLNGLRDQLLQLLAELEAGLDFVEEDIEFISPAMLAERLETAAQTLRNIATQVALRMTDEASDQVVLIGPPNAGKSRLFNTLVDHYGATAKYEHARRSALVSAIRGTTRDYLTSTVALDGMHCLLVDTAGIENEEPDAPTLSAASQAASINSRAQALTSERRARASIRVWCRDITQPVAAPADCDLLVLTKADLRSNDWGATRSTQGGVPMVVTSSHTGEGIAELAAALRQLLTREAVASSAPIVSTTAHRCHESIRLAEISLRRAADAATNRDGDELVAQQIRDGLAELGKVVGAVYTDDLLDRIFSSFCIGK